MMGELGKKWLRGVGVTVPVTGVEELRLCQVGNLFPAVDSHVV
jgi:hypothetical protein